MLQVKGDKGRYRSALGEIKADSSSGIQELKKKSSVSPCLCVPEKESASSASSASEKLEYHGLDSSELVSKYWELTGDGQPPTQGDRNTKIFDLACSLRHIFNFDRELLNRAIPNYDGFPQEEITFTAEEGVQTHIATNCPGALSACRFQFDIPLEGLGAGTHKLCVYAKDTAGNEELIREITLIIAQVDPVEAIEAIEFDGTNGAMTLEAGETVKFMVRNQGGKKIVIENAASLSVTADNLAGVAVGLTATEGTSIVQEIPGEGWDNIEVTIHNATDAAATINFTVVEIG